MVGSPYIYREAGDWILTERLSCFFLLSDLAVVRGWLFNGPPRFPDPPLDTTYLYSSLSITWFGAKLFCECHGSLAVLDTEAEFNAFRRSV